MKDNQGFLNIFKNKLLLAYAIGGFLVSFGSNIVFNSFLTEYLVVLDFEIIPTMIFTLTFLLLTFGLFIWGPYLGRWIDKRYSPNGRRKIYLLVSSIAIGFIVLSTFILPIKLGILDPLLNILFILLIIGANTVGIFIFSLNYSSLFPEMFQSLQERADARTIVLIMVIIGNLVGALVPLSLNFPYLPFISSILVFVGTFVLLRYGVEEPYNKLLMSYKIEPTIQKQQSILKNPLFKSFLIFSILLLVSIQLLDGGFSYNISNLLSIMRFHGVSSEMTDFLGLLNFIGAQIIGILFLVYWRKISLTRGIQKSLKLVLIMTLILIVACTISFDIYSGIILSFILNGLLIGISFFLILFLAMIIDNYYINTMRRREASHIGVYNLISGIFGLIATIFLSYTYVFGALFVSFGTETEFLFGYIPKDIAFIVGGILISIALLLLKKFPLNEEECDKIEYRVKEINNTIKIDE